MSASVSVLSHMFSSSPQWLVFSTRSPPGRVVSSCSSPFGTKSFCILLRAFPPGFCSCRIAALCRLFPWWSLANPRPFCGFPWLPPPFVIPWPPGSHDSSWLPMAFSWFLVTHQDSPWLPWLILPFRLSKPSFTHRIHPSVLIKNRSHMRLTWKENNTMSHITWI